MIDGRLLCVDLELNGTKFRIINVYCPNELHDRLETIQALNALILCGWEVVTGGDFNCIVNKKDRSSSSTTDVKLDSSSYALTNMIKDQNLIDVFKTMNPPTPGFTWSNGRTSSRIDFLLISLGVTPLDCSISPVLFSDHSKLTALSTFWG